MSPSSHAFYCWIGTLPVIPLNFALDNPRGGWAVLILSVIILLIAVILRIKERRNEK